MFWVTLAVSEHILWVRTFITVEKDEHRASGWLLKAQAALTELAEQDNADKRSLSCLGGTACILRVLMRLAGFLCLGLYYVKGLQADVQSLAWSGSKTVPLLTVLTDPAAAPTDARRPGDREAVLH